MRLYTYGAEEAQKIAQEAVKKIDKSGYSTSYVDMPVAIKIMREFRTRNGLGNKVEIALKPEVKFRKQSGYQKSIRTMVCPFTRLTFGIFKGLNPATQAPMWSPVELDEYVSLNLEKDEDAALWLILRLCPCIEDSVTSGKYADTPYWEFHDVRAENSNVIQKAGLIVKITEILTAMSGSDMLNLARLFKYQSMPGDETSIKIVDIHGYLLNIALSDPEEFMRKYKDSNRSVLELIYAAESTGMVRYSHENGYNALGNPIGLTVEEAVSTLRKDRNLMSLIKQEVISNDLLAKTLEDQKPDPKTKQEVFEEAAFRQTEDEDQLV